MSRRKPRGRAGAASDGNQHAASRERVRFPKPGSIKIEAPANWLELLPPREELTRDVLARARELGFAAVGVAPAEPSHQIAELQSWLEAGAHGSMDFMAKDIALRADPRGHLQGTRAFLMVADVYASREANTQLGSEITPPGFGKIARYAQGRNYHNVMKRRLHTLADALRKAYPGSDFRSFVDTAPVLERELAMRAGLGWQAKNSMLIHPKLGSYILLAGAATNLPLVAIAQEDVITDACGSCTRCIDACPTNAITPRRVDASRCISYLTIEHTIPIAPDLQSKVGNWLYGCDICQEVCPHNSPRDASFLAELLTSSQPVDPAVNSAYLPTRTGFVALDVLNWNDAARRDAFVNSAMKRAPLAVMRRNAVLVVGNTLAAEILANPGSLTLDQRNAMNAALVRVANNPAEDSLVSLAAKDVLQRLASLQNQQQP